MPPKRKLTAKAEDEDEGNAVVNLAHDDGDDEKKPPAAAAAAAVGKRNKPAPVRRSDDYAYGSGGSDEDDEDDEDEEYGKSKKKKKAAAPAKKKKAKEAPGSSAKKPAAAAAAGTTPSKRQHVPRAEPGPEPTEREVERSTGYTLDPSLPLMWTAVSADGEVGPDVEVEPRAKIAAFDLDGTLVHVKGTGAGRTYPIHEDDWVLFNDRVPATVRRYHREGYEIAILSNQGGVKSKLAGKMAQMIKARSASVAATLGVPCRVLLCPSIDDANDYRKPQTGMWTFLEQELRGPGAPRVDRAQCVFVGDAAGRAGDHNGKGADSDRRFADALGVPFLTPEEAFGAQKGKGAIDAETWKAGVEAVKAAKEGGGEAEGAGPNAALLAALAGLSDKIFDLIKKKPECLPGDGVDKWRFKAAAYKAAASSIAGGFHERITLQNLKAVGKLPKVGKSTLEKLKECLENGRIRLMDELEGYEAAGAAPAAAVPAHVQQQQAAAAAFM